MDTYVVLWLSWVKLLWTWGCRSLSYTPHPIHFSLSPLLLSWSKFPFLSSSYISLPPVLSLAINFLTQFQFCFIPEEYMYIVLRFGIKNWRFPLDSLLQVSHSQFIFMIGPPENLDYRGKLVDCGVIRLSSVCTALWLWGLLLWIMDSRAHGLSSCGVQTYLFCGTWDPSSPARDWTGVPCIGRQFLNHWTTREVPVTVDLFIFAAQKG